MSLSIAAISLKSASPLNSSDSRFPYTREAPKSLFINAEAPLGGWLSFGLLPATVEDFGLVVLPPISKESVDVTLFIAAIYLSSAV